MTGKMLMVLKDVRELVLSLTFTDESLFYLESKLSEHRELLLNAFPDCRLQPKHHYIEHYPNKSPWTSHRHVDNEIRREAQVFPKSNP